MLIANVGIKTPTCACMPLNSREVMMTERCRPTRDRRPEKIKPRNNNSSVNGVHRPIMQNVAIAILPCGTAIMSETSGGSSMVQPSKETIWEYPTTNPRNNNTVITDNADQIMTGEFGRRIPKSSHEHR